MSSVGTRIVSSFSYVIFARWGCAGALFCREW